MAQITITDELIKALDTLHLNLTHFYLLLTASEGNYNNCSVINTQTLTRKNWIKEEKLTESGQLLFDSLNSLVKPLETLRQANIQPDIKQSLRQQKRAQYKASSEAFSKWWKEYPVTTSFVDKNGKKWNNGRSLKVKMAECEAKFLQWMADGADVDKMIEMVAWEYEKLQKRTIATGEDQMGWMPSSQRFLNKHNYHDLLKQMEIEQEIGTSEIQKIKNNINNDFI